MLENTTVASFKAEMIDHRTTGSFEEDMNINQQTLNVKDLAEDQNGLKPYSFDG